jgi:hypothetical protein
MNFSLSMLDMTEPWRKCSLIQLSFALYIKPEFCRVALNCALICRFRQCILRKVLLLKSFCHTYLIVGKRFMVESFKVCSKRCLIQYLVLVNSDKIVPKNYCEKLCEDENHGVRYTRESLPLHPPIRQIFSFNQNK